MKKQFFYSILAWLMIIGGEKTYAQYSIKDFQPLHDLAGTWKMPSKKGFLFEYWQRINDSTLQNNSYRVNGIDSIPQETVELTIANGAIMYISTVVNQNNHLPVTFFLVKKDNGKYIFENKKHDFPQQITYYLKDKNQLQASISGSIKGEYKEILFYYERVK